MTSLVWATSPDVWPSGRPFWGYKKFYCFLKKGVRSRDGKACFPHQDDEASLIGLMRLHSSGCQLQNPNDESRINPEGLCAKSQSSLCLSFCEIFSVVSLFVDAVGGESEKSLQI